MSHYQKLKAMKTCLANDFHTAVFADSVGGHYNSISGTPPLMLNKSKGLPLRCWSFIGNTTQNGAGVGEKTENLFPPNAKRYEYAIDGDIRIKNYSGGCMYFVNVKTNTDYVVTINSLNESTFIKTATTNNPNIGAVVDDFKESSYSVDPSLSLNSGNNQWLVLYVSAAFAENHNDVNKLIMLNEGSTPIPHEPFGKYKIPVVCGKHTTNIYLDSPLMAYEKLISDGTREFKWGKMILTGDESWIHPSSSELFYITDLPIDYNKRLNNPESNYYSTHFAASSASTSSAGMKEGEIRFYNGVVNTQEMYIKLSGISTVEDFRLWLRQQSENGTPVIVYYQLANPLTEAFDVPEIPTSKGSISIYTNTVVRPSEIILEYKSRR